MILARNEPFVNQAIDSQTDRSRREPDFRADGIDRERALMQERFEYAEIRVGQLCLFDALRCVGKQRLKSLHKNEPQMHTGGVLFFSGAFLFHCDLDLTTIILMSIYFKSIQ